MKNLLFQIKLLFLLALQIDIERTPSNVAKRWIRMKIYKHRKEHENFKSKNRKMA